MELEQSIKQVEGARPIFGELFYDKLFQQHPDLQEFFRHTTIRQQAAVLTMQLYVIEAYHVRGSEAAALYLQVLGTRHSDRGIPQDAFPRFCNALVDALKQFHGAQWSTDLERQWREAIEASTKKMLEGYQSRFHV